MTKEALIQIGLTEEQAEKVVGLYNDEIKNFVPKEKIEELQTEKSQLETSISERDKQLKELKGAAGLTEDLKQKLEDAIAKNKADTEKAAAEFAAYKKENAVNLQLVKLGAKNVTAVKALIDLNKISLDGENIMGLSDQIEAVKISDEYLFEPAISGREPYSGDKTPTDVYKNNPFKKETFNLTRQGQLLRENPELANKMKIAAGLK